MIVTVDLETYYDDEFTLKKLTTEAYVRDARFSIHGAAIKYDTAPAQWFEGEALRNELARAAGTADAFLAHHAQFDGLGINHHLGIRPRFWLDTLAMARLLVGNHLSVSLDNLAKHFNLSAKSVPYELFRGKHWSEIPKGQRDQIAAGACHDADLTFQIFCILAPDFPTDEFHLVDKIIRMFTEPVIVGDTARFAEVWNQEYADKVALLAEVGADKKTLGSDGSFAQLLINEGIEPDKKMTDKGNVKWAFAKTDPFMQDLLESEDDRLRMLAEARVATKSAGTQTRAERLGWMSTRGRMCVYITPYGAHTTRTSGGDKVNWQNRKRGGPLESALRAPDGCCFVVDDASQIECRLLNETAGQADVVDKFRRGEDLYIEIASRFYDRPITRDDPAERGLGKQLELSCGYGAGGPTIVRTARRGTYGPPIYLSEAEGMQARDLYRGTHTKVVDLWGEAGEILGHMALGRELDWKCLHIKNKRIYLPNGAPLIYDTLEWVTEDGESFWRIKTRKGWTKLYGAKLVENIIQALARLHVTTAWLKCAQAGIKIVSFEHDKLIAVCHKSDADDVHNYMKMALCTPPPWLPNVPLDSDGYISETFAKVKT